MGGLAFLFRASLVAALLSLNPAAAAAPSPNFRGIALQDEAYYRTATIRCKDGSKSFSSDRLNDDFCDCADGTDEPGTAACPNGKFHCRNKGHTPIEIYSSRVNDGICDCCDGSDEYDGKAKCSNTCSQAGKVMKEKLERKISTFKGGLEIRKRDVEQAKHMMSKEKVELSNLKQEEKKLKDQVQKLKAKKEAIEKAEQQEKLKREKEEKARKEAEMKVAKEAATEDEKTEPVKGDQILEDHVKNPEEETYAQHSEQKETLEDDEVVASEENHEGLSKEELGRLVASRWTGENPNIEKEGAESTESESMYDEDVDHEHEDEASSEDEDDEKDAEDDEEDEKDAEDDQDEPEEAAQASGSTGDNQSQEGPWWNKLKDKIKEFSDSIFVKAPVNKSEAERVRKEYKDSSSKLSDVQTKISDLEKKLEQDFGKDGEFYSLYGHCFELRLQKYTYKVCPFRNGVQMESHSTTTLGNWEGFKDEYRSMSFVRGDKCWNGPDRSLKVKLRCGSKIELRDVDEPSRCEYVAELSTPAVCLQERLAALEQRLQDKGDATRHHEEL